MISLTAEVSGINVHAITRAQVAENALCGNLQSHATQFRIASGLNVVNS